MELINQREKKSIEMYLQNTVKANNFLDVFQSNEKQLSAIKRESGEMITASIVMQQLHRIESVLGVELTEPQLDVMVGNIINDFWHFKIADFNLIVKRLSYVKQYGKPEVGDIMSEIVQYNIERMNVAEAIGDIKVKEDESERLKINDNIRKTYAAIKRKAKEPVKSQKEIDKENREANTEKIAELKRRYPDSKI